MRKRVGWLLLILSLVSSACQAREAGRARMNLLVWDLAGVPPELLRPAAREIIRILADAGIEVAWFDCGRPKAVTIACNRPSDRSDFALRLLPRPPAEWRVSGVALGLTFAHSANVFLDRIHLESVRLYIPEYLVLACIAAHEIGHLLLPPGYHSLAGLMRARMDHAQWDAALHGHLFFCRQDVQMMHGVLHER